MSVITKIYDASPVWVQNLMCSTKGWLITRRRFNSHFYWELEQFEAHQYDPKETLCRFLRRCGEVDFYRESIDPYFLTHLTPENVYEEMKRLPIISKADVREHLSEISALNGSGSSITMHTSGTTGGGLVFPYSVEMENKQWAVWWRYRRRLGIQLDTWCGWLGGRSIISSENRKPPYWRINRPGRQVMYSAHHLSADTVRYYHEDISKRKLTWLHGYPSSTSLLASLIIENGLTPIDSVRWVTTGAENLLEHHIEMIHKAFPNAMVRTHYGLA